MKSHLLDPVNRKTVPELQELYDAFAGFLKKYPDMWFFEYGEPTYFSPTKLVMVFHPQYTPMLGKAYEHKHRMYEYFLGRGWDVDIQFRSGETEWNSSSSSS